MRSCTATWTTTTLGTFIQHTLLRPMINLNISWSKDLKCDDASSPKNGFSPNWKKDQKLSRRRSSYFRHNCRQEAPWHLTHKSPIFLLKEIVELNEEKKSGEREEKKRSPLFSFFYWDNLIASTKCFFSKSEKSKGISLPSFKLGLSIWRNRSDWTGRRQMIGS